MTLNRSITVHQAAMAATTFSTSTLQGAVDPEQGLCIHDVYTMGNVTGQDFAPLVSVEDTLRGRAFLLLHYWMVTPRERPPSGTNLTLTP